MLTVLKLPASLSSLNTQAPGVPLRRRALLSSLLFSRLTLLADSHLSV